MTSVTLNIEPKELGQWYRKLGPRMNKAALRGAKRGGLRAVAILQRATSAAGPANPGGIGTGGAVNTAFYKRAWKSEPTPTGVRVYNGARYSSIIESGRRPGKFPPLAVIRDWAQRRLGLSAEEAKRAAFPIARAIAKRGLVGRKVMATSLPKIYTYFLQAVVAELDNEMKKAGL